MMNRRDFLIGAAGGAAALSLSPRLALGSPGSPGFGAQFRSELAKKPWLLGWASASRDEFDSRAVITEGKLPKELVGTLYRNGPGGHEVGGRRYEHWFDGDGLINAFRFADGALEHKGRFVETEKRQREREAGRPLVSGFGTAWPDLPGQTGPAAGNAANTSVLVHGDDLLALWEGGEAYALDPQSLETRGKHTWSDETADLPFSAHPRLDSDGVLWNFGTAAYANMLLIYRIGTNGKLSSLTPVQVESLSFIHDFVVTDHHLVFMMSPLRYDNESDGKHFLGRHHWRKNEATRWLVVDKSDFSKQRWFESPASFVFHFGNAWEESGHIRVDASMYPDASIMFEQQTDVMRGKWVGDVAEATTITLNLASGATSQEEHGIRREFPVIDNRVSGQRHEFVLSVASLEGVAASHPLANGIAREDTTTGKVQTFAFPETVTPEEHVFVPNPAGTRSTQGWAIGTALDFGRSETQLNVFDAEHIDDGPVATTRFPYALPLGFHGKFSAAKR